MLLADINEVRAFLLDKIMSNGDLCREISGNPPVKPEDKAVIRAMFADGTTWQLLDTLCHSEKRLAQFRLGKFGKK